MATAVVATTTVADVLVHATVADGASLPSLSPPPSSSSPVGPKSVSRSPDVDQAATGCG